MSEIQIDYPFTIGEMTARNASHTPGPWIVAEGDSQYSGVDADGQNIILNSDLGEFCGVRGRSYEESLANVILIAAAPSLLEACKWALDGATPLGDGRTVQEMLADVIAKAEGHSSLS